MRYWCDICGRVYEELTQDGLCEDIECYGSKLKEYTGVQMGVIEGLCILICDTSYSMDQKAFADDEVIKLEMVTRAVHKAIAELASITKPDEAFISIIAFGARAVLVPDYHGKPFVKSVREIEKQFEGNLGEYLFESFKNDKPQVGRSSTDIGAALLLAHEVYDAALSGDLSRFDPRRAVRLLKQKDIDTVDEKRINVPNVRVMLYSDGEHNVGQPGALINPFKSLKPSPLMTAFIGAITERTRPGADQLKELATICPIHGNKGYFLINSPKRYAVLRKLFRMASGASGFCPECLIEYVDAAKEEEASYE